MPPTTTTTTTTTTLPPTTTTTTLPPTTTTTTLPYPDGFSQVSFDLAARTISSDDPEWPGCDYFDRCIVVQLYAIDDCPNGGYIEATIEENGVIVDYTNDLIPALRAGDRYNSTLGRFGGGPGTYDITQVECY